MNLLLFFSFFLFFGLAGAEEISEGKDSLTQSIIIAENSSDQRSLEKKSSSENLEKIKVTGSRISRIDLEGPSPVVIFTKEDLDKSGYLSVGGFLRNTNLSLFGGIDIHNRSTLTLVNGSRLLGGTSAIPITAVERIEVLKDGASALYGSDVVGGVINIITKKEFNSSDASAKGVFYKNGYTGEASLVFGKKGDKGHFVSTLRAQGSDSMKVEDRKDWYNKRILPQSPKHAAFQVKGSQEWLSPTCPSDQKTRTGCLYDFTPHFNLSPLAYGIESYNYGEYKTGENTWYTQWFGSFGQTRKYDQMIYAEDLEIPAGHKMSVGGGQVGVLKYIFEDISLRDEVGTGFVFDVLAGVKGYLSRTWDYDFQVKYSGRRSKRYYAGHPYTESLLSAIVSGAYDPFDETKRDFSSVDIFANDASSSRADYLFSSLDFSGETGLWDIDMALGFQGWSYFYEDWRHEDVNQTYKPDSSIGKVYGFTPSELGELQRHILASYVEFIKGFSESVEVQVAGRVDRYSDFGWTVNPKLAAYWRPSSQFLFRSSFGTSFEAPGLASLYAPETIAYVRIYDTVACYNELKQDGFLDEVYQTLEGSQEEKDKVVKEFLIEQSFVVESSEFSDEVKESFRKLTSSFGDRTYCISKHIRGTTKPNKNLKETRAKTLSMGFHWQPNSNHSLTMDYWWNSLSGTPLPSFATKTTVDAELRHDKAYVEERGVQYERDSASPYNAIKEGTPVDTTINIGGKKLNGIDLSWHSDFPDWRLWDGNFYLKNNFSWVIKAGVETFPGMGYVNNLGKYSLPKWRNFLRLGWKSRAHDLSLYLKTVAGTKKANNEFESTPAYTIVDLFYSYRYDAKTSFHAGIYNASVLDFTSVKNLFSLTPPHDDSRTQGWKFGTSIFGVLGPQIFVELKRSI